MMMDSYIKECCFSIILFLADIFKDLQLSKKPYDAIKLKEVKL